MIDLKQFYQPKELDNGMIRVNGKPHVTDLAHLDSACTAPATSVYYFVSKYFNANIDSKLLLTELAKLQDTNPNSKTYGCMKWYRESTRIQDTNSAFFTLRNICYALKFCPQNVSQDELDIIMPMLKLAVNWFKHECKYGGFFYPNKIMSDGALLVLLSDVLKDKSIIDDALDFWTRWMDYTDEYGWGWGENTSKNYAAVMKDALIVALMGIDNTTDIYKRLLGIYKRLLDYCAYHDDYEFTPSIRTYNFEGKTNSGSNPANSNIIDPEKITNGVISEIILHENAPKIDITPDPSDFHKERIFGDSYAVTYKGENIRLGTVTKFPVMCNCYEQRGWGLGWQSMPVSAIALKHETAFMRFVTVSNGEFRSHMSTGWKDKNLFPDVNIPDIYTYSNQHRNTAVVVRMVEHVANTSSYFADEWFFQHFDGEIKQINDWYVFDYGDCALCIKCLDGVLELKKEGEKVRLINKFYEGQEKLLVCSRYLSSWAIVALDSSEDIEEKLSNTTVLKENIYDPRYSRSTKPFKLTCGNACLEFDPDKINLI